MFSLPLDMVLNFESNIVSELSENLIVGGFYPTPRDVNDIYSLYVASVEQSRSKYVNYEHIIVGEYNLPKTTWTYCSSLSDSLYAQCNSSGRVIQENHKVILNGFSYLCLYQYFLLPCHYDKRYVQPGLGILIFFN